MPAAQFSGLGIDFVSEAYKFNNVLNFFPLLRHGLMPALHGQSNVVVDGFAVDQRKMLKYHADIFSCFTQHVVTEPFNGDAVDRDATGRQFFQPVDTAQQGRFSCPATSNKTVDIALVDGQVDAV